MIATTLLLPHDLFNTKATKSNFAQVRPVLRLFLLYLDIIFDGTNVFCNVMVISVVAADVDFWLHDVFVFDVDLSSTASELV